MLGKAVFVCVLALTASQALVPSPPASSVECIPREQCKVCRKGRACGNTCIRADYDCHKGQGCACDEEEVCR
jgi:hypothetical protein